LVLGNKFEPDFNIIKNKLRVLK